MREVARQIANSGRRPCKLVAVMARAIRGWSREIGIGYLHKALRLPVPGKIVRHEHYPAKLR